MLQLHTRFFSDHLDHYNNQISKYTYSAFSYFRKHGDKLSISSLARLLSKHIPKYENTICDLMKSSFNKYLCQQMSKESIFDSTTFFFVLYSSLLLFTLSPLYNENGQKVKEN